MVGGEMAEKDGKVTGQHELATRDGVCRARSALIHARASGVSESLLASRPPSRLPALNLCITMGNDGGSIPDRRDLVKTKAKVLSSTVLTKA